MCLIIYAPDAQPIPADHFASAAFENPDGIGIMSTDGIEKFIGRKKTRRARQYAASLAKLGIPYGVHFRWATHGSIGRDNTHPFEVPGTALYLMHNGVLWTAAQATDDASDTAIFARDVMPLYAEWMTLEDRQEWLATLELEATGNRLLLMDGNTGKFEIVHEKMGAWIGGLWYSNTYSLDVYDPPKVAGRFSRQATGRIVMPSYGSALSTTGDSDYEDWFQRARAREAQGNKFDWHDRSTWDKYPIPGSWDDRYPLAADGPAACEEDDEDDRMSGVQTYI